MSNKDFESVRRWTGAERLCASYNCVLSTQTSSNKSENALTSDDSTERVTLLDSLLFNDIGITLSLSSIRGKIRPSCDDKSLLFVYASSRYSTIRGLLLSSFGNSRDVTMRCAYLIAELSFFKNSLQSFKKFYYLQEYFFTWLVCPPIVGGALCDNERLILIYPRCLDMYLRSFCAISARFTNEVRGILGRKNERTIGNSLNTTAEGTITFGPSVSFIANIANASKT